VLCDTWTPKGVALPTNTRAPAKAIFDKGLELQPWFGIEQEYVLIFHMKFSFCAIFIYSDILSLWIFNFSSTRCLVV
jgi:hypothetical protein